MKKNVITKKIGDFLQKRRLELNLSQEDVAERAKLHRTYIGSVERGERNISIVNLKKIAEALDITIHELLEDEL